jgi:GcrA cell cycle regulator
MLWTDEAVDNLKRLAGEGWSASVIAAALGAESRNAVIGKANRIGIKLTGGGRAAATDRPRATARPRPPVPFPALADGGATGFLALGPEVERKRRWNFAGAEVGEMRRVSLETISEFTCRWPLGDPRSDEFAYCGLIPAEGHSYCAGHCRLAYRSPEARARRSPDERPGSRPLANSWRAA